MKQTYAAIAGTLFFLVFTVGVAVAEGEVPATSPTEPQPLSAVVAEQPAPPANPESGAPLESGTPAEKPKSEEESWRPVVNSLRPGYWDASILPVQGVAMYYNPGVFQQVLDFRYEHNHITECDECIGYVALLRTGDIDRRVWLQRKDRIAEGPFWVVDVAARKDIPGLLSRNWVVDIDHKTAMRWRMAGPIPITVYDADSPEAQEAAAAYFSSELIPLDERYIIPPDGYSYRTLDGEMESAASPQTHQPQKEALLADGIAVENGGPMAEVLPVLADTTDEDPWLD
ncbi:MAG: hypothetical protein HY328_12190 [Chloroflexi bacterium]|nr:hypothetical protein [Chloroflexota bacterium]